MPRPATSLALRAAGIALPPTVRQFAARSHSISRNVVPRRLSSADSHINALAIRGVEDQSSVRRKLAQFAEPGLVPPPSFYGRPVDRLTRLPKTCGGDLAGIAMRLQARVIPIETAGGDKPSNLRLRVRDQGLIVHLDEPIRRQHLSPMGHHPLILPVVEHDVAPVRAEGKVCIKIGHEDGKSGVDRIAPTMDEGGVGEDAMDEA